MDHSYLTKALEFHKKNQLKKAIKIYIDLLDKPEANKNQILFLLGTAYYQAKNFKESINYFKNLLSIEPNNFHAYSNMALAQKELNQIDEAIFSFNKSIEINPKFSHSYNNLGNLYLEQLKYKDAIKCYSEAINIEPEKSFFLNRSICFYKINEISKAKNDLDKYGNVHDHEKSFFHYIDLLRYEKNYSEILKILKISGSKFNYEKLRKIEIEAKIHLDLTDDLIVVINKLKSKFDINFYSGLYYYKINDIKKSKICFNEALIENPNSSNLINNLALIAKDEGNFTEAKKLFNKSLSIDNNLNDSKVNLGLIYLHEMDFKKGWDFYYFRNKDISKLSNNNLFEVKDIKDKNRILVLNEQGLGDQLIYLHVLNKIKDPDKFYFIVDDRLYNLFTNYYPDFHFVKNSSKVNNSFDDFIFIADLLKYFILSPSDLNFSRPLFPLHATQKKPNGVINCGVAWKSPNSNFQSRVFKSLDLISILENIDIQELNYFNLQYGNIDDDINLVKENLNLDIKIEDDLDYFNDIESLLSLISKLDLVITTSNVTAHLAGAVGKKTYLLVPESIGRIWYWHNSEISLWYPNTRQYFYNENNFKEKLLKVSNQIKDDFLIS